MPNFYEQKIEIKKNLAVIYKQNILVIIQTFDNFYIYPAMYFFTILRA